MVDTDLLAVSFELPICTKSFSSKQLLRSVYGLLWQVGITTVMAVALTVHMASTLFASLSNSATQ